MASEIGTFLTEMIRHPGEVVAIAPSSKKVAKKMTEGLEHVRGPVVEIGPGTGAITKAILKRGVTPAQLTLFETNPRFCDMLRARYPGVTVLNRPAQDIRSSGLRGVGAVISGVPVLARPQIQREVVGRALGVMAPGGMFVQITYSPTAPISPPMQAELGIVGHRRGIVWSNLPPAHVYVYTRTRH
ncbi:methyltransferase type 12 [Rhodobacteraceae bacterium D3-12]|nr:methyltransferase type 12 [Rhodobacteraceae bacterium D3-12]